MATEAQMNANRENAKKSTGPRTPEGKNISSRNSLVHGMTSGKFLPPDGDPEEYFQLLDQFRDRFKPFDEPEATLVERMVAAEFKMRSVRYMDAGIFHYELKTNPMPQHFSEDERTNPLAWAFQCDSAGHNSFTKLIRYEGFLQRDFSRSLRDLFKMQDERRAREAEAVREAETKPQPPVPDPQPREQSSPEPPANPKTEKTNRTQFPEPRDTPDGGWVRDAPQDPTPAPLPDESEDPPKR
jgi:hypothetical protein